jgi:hypothetical protein
MKQKAIKYTAILYETMLSLGNEFPMKFHA